MLNFAEPSDNVYPSSPCHRFLCYTAPGIQTQDHGVIVAQCWPLTPPHYYWLDNEGILLLSWSLDMLGRKVQIWHIPVFGKEIELEIRLISYLYQKSSLKTWECFSQPVLIIIQDPFYADWLNMISSTRLGDEFRGWQMNQEPKTLYKRFQKLPDIIFKPTNPETTCL